MDKINLNVDKKRTIKTIIKECLDQTSCLHWGLLDNFAWMDMFASPQGDSRYWVRIEIRPNYVKIYRQQQSLVDENTYKEIGRREFIEVETRIQRKYYMDIFASITADIYDCDTIGHEFIRKSNIVYRRGGKWRLR